MRDGGNGRDGQEAAQPGGWSGIAALEGAWSRMARARRGHAPEVPMRQWREDHWVLHALGIGIEPFHAWFGRTDATDFPAFARWLQETAGDPPADRLARLETVLAGLPLPPDAQRLIAEVDRMEPVLSGEDLAFWDAQGYVVLHDAVPPDDAAAAARAIWEFISAQPEDPATWYPFNDHGIMVQLFQHEALERNRRNLRIHKAFAQLWGTADLWCTTDRVGFNAPETPSHRFRGPHLHWDVSLRMPVPFGTQGILYLADTRAEQGAFTLVPGFHQRLGAWLDGLPGGPASARTQDLQALGAVPIAGRAGDLIIWHHALPHGSRPNTADRPRLVQYMNFFPADAPAQDEWI